MCSLSDQRNHPPYILHCAYYVKDRDSKQAIGMVTHVCRCVTISAKRARMDQHTALSDQGSHPPYYCRVLTTWKPGMAGHRYGNTCQTEIAGHRYGKVPAERARVELPLQFSCLSLYAAAASDCKGACWMPVFASEPCAADTQTSQAGAVAGTPVDVCM